MTGIPPVSFVGTLPPPVTGMTMATAIVVDRLRECSGVRIHNISHNRHDRGVRWRFIKAWKSASGAARLLTWRTGPRPRLYLVANAGLGIWYNVAHVLAARARGYHVIIHHQVYNYVTQHDERMERLVRSLGPDSTHIMLCPEMKASFQRQYAPEGNLVVVPNTIVMLDQRRPTSDRPHVPFRLGHLSNLTVDKGLDRVLDTFAAVRHRGLDVELVLAGPAASAEASRLIEDARRSFGDALDYRGPVYDDDKWSFYADIDAVLFPTRYRREAYPLVLAEALFAGVPVVTYGRACIPSLVGSDGGLVLPPDRDFSSAASELVERWVEQPEVYRQDADRTRTRGEALLSEARRSLDALIDCMCGL